MEKTIKQIKAEGIRPKLLLHVCCAPCSGYVLNQLAESFDITLYFYNPNIYPVTEYIRRKDELISFIIRLAEKNGLKPFKVIERPYYPYEFTSAIEGNENAEEGGSRCLKCFELRLFDTAKYAKENGFDFFTTTLSISPHKNSKNLNLIGEKASLKHDIKYLYSDFKKKGGYLKSTEIAKEYDLYRQDYCGCYYSLKQSMLRREEKKLIISLD